MEHPVKKEETAPPEIAGIDDNRRLSLAHLPTPLLHSERLSQLVDCELWIKHDDATGGATAGNKIRKLEYLLAEACSLGASVVLTCGGLQSNHARATALLARSLGICPIVFLRTSAKQPPLVGNYFLDRLCGAEVRFVSPEQYARRSSLMEEAAEELRQAGERPYVIPEGGSSGLGALGYVSAMEEIRHQLDERGPSGGFDVVVHACGSGGTAAGCTLGAAQFDVAPEVCAMAVCDDAATFEARIDELVGDAQRRAPSLKRRAKCIVDDRFIGPGYAEVSDEQTEFVVRVARQSGVVLDPVYSGKALFGLAQLAGKYRRVLFLHTGGLPGLLAQSEVIAARSWPSR